MEEVKTEEVKTEEVKAEDIEIREFTRILKVMFPVKERLGIGDQMANAIRNIKQAQDELKSVKAQYDSKIKQFEAEVANLSERLNSGWEMRSVECAEIKDFRMGNVFVRRTDTGDYIEERAMTFQERQGTLPLKEKEPETGPTEGEERSMAAPDMMGVPYMMGVPELPTEGLPPEEKEAEALATDGIPTGSKTIGEPEAGVEGEGAGPLSSDINAFYVGEGESGIK